MLRAWIELLPLFLVRCCLVGCENGCRSSLQVSSSSGMAPHIWLGIDDPDPKILAADAAEHGVKTDQITGWSPTRPGDLAEKSVVGYEIIDATPA